MWKIGRYELHLSEGFADEDLSRVWPKARDRGGSGDMCPEGYANMFLLSR